MFSSNKLTISKYTLSIIILGILAFTGGCKQKEQKHILQQEPFNTLSNYETWADTIIYDILVHNPDSTDEWQSHKIKYLDRKKMVDDIFTSVYSGKKKAYNYYTNQVMDISDIKELEENYKREDVGKVQFTESWYYNKETGVMQKKIHNILIAYTLYTYDNKIRGYKAAFYIKNEPDRDNS